MAVVVVLGGRGTTRQRCSHELTATTQHRLGSDVTDLHYKKCNGRLCCPESRGILLNGINHVRFGQRCMRVNSDYCALVHGDVCSYRSGTEELGGRRVAGDGTTVWVADYCEEGSRKWHHCLGGQPL